MLTNIKLLPHWCITESYPAFYDTDSKTSIEMVAKLYGSMSEMQHDYNRVIDELNKTITDFINDVNSDQEEFQCRITKIIHDYIAMIDEKIKMQDYVIEESILYMKNNLSEATEKLFNDLIKSGKVKNAITTYEYDDLNETLIFKMGGDN